MIDFLIYACIVILFIILLGIYGQSCYRLGLLNSKGALNVICEETADGFMFYNLLTKSFICQSKTYDDGVTILQLKFTTSDIIISMANKTKVIDETI